MKNVSRLTIAAILVLVLVLVAGGVWAAPVFNGTIGSVPKTGSNVQPPLAGGGTTGTIDMGTALFTPTCVDCKVNVDLVEDPAALAPAPSGKQFMGDAFKVTIDPATGTVKISFAFPPEIANKNAKIYKLNSAVTPPVWEEVLGAVITNGVISVEGGSGTYTLIGDN
jgi:hypothetical protein